VKLKKKKKGTTPFLLKAVLAYSLCYFHPGDIGVLNWSLTINYGICTSSSVEFIDSFATI
jgi:hypothetical protein